MSKVRDNSAPKMILGACWGARSLAIPCQARNTYKVRTDLLI